MPNNYYPNGKGGYSVYDDDWNLVSEMPGDGYPLSAKEFPHQIDNPPTRREEVDVEKNIRYLHGRLPGYEDYRLLRKQDDKLRYIFHAAFGGKGEPPPLTQFQREAGEEQDEIMGRAMEKLIQNLPVNDFLNDPLRDTDRPSRMRYTPEGKPYFDPLYSSPVLAMAGYQEGGEVGEPIIIDRVPNDPAWEEDFYQAPNPDEAPYYPTQYIEPQEPSWMRPIRAMENTFSGMIPRDLESARGLLTSLGNPSTPGWFGEVAKAAVGQYGNFRTLVDEPIGTQEWWNAAVPTGLGYAGQVAPFAGEIRAAAGGRFLPGASSEAGIMLSPAGGGGGLSREIGAVPDHIWQEWKVVQPGKMGLPQPPDLPEVITPEIRVDNAGNYFEKVGSHRIKDPKELQRAGPYTEEEGKLYHHMVKPIENPFIPKSTKQWHELSSEAQWHFKQKYKINSDAFAEQQWNDSLKSMTPEQLLGPNLADQHFARWDMWETLPDDIKRQYPDPDKLTDFDWQKIKEYLEGDEPLSPLDLEHQKYVDESFKENLGDKIKKMSDEAQHIDDPEFEKKMDWDLEHPGEPYPPDLEPPLPPLPTPGTPEWEQYLNPFKKPENLPPRVPPMTPLDLSDAEYLDYLKRKHSLGDFPDMGPYEPGGPRWPQGGGYQEGGVVGDAYEQPTGIDPRENYPTMIPEMLYSTAPDPTTGESRVAALNAYEQTGAVWQSGPWLEQDVRQQRRMQHRINRELAVQDHLLAQLAQQQQESEMIEQQRQAARENVFRTAHIDIGGQEWEVPVYQGDDLIMAEDRARDFLEQGIDPLTGEPLIPEQLYTP